MAKAVKKPVGQAELSEDAVATIREIRKAAMDHWTALDQMCDLEGSGRRREWLRSQKVTDAAYERLKRVARKVLARPVRSLSDIAVLAELAQAHHAGEVVKMTDADTGEHRYLDLRHEILSVLLDRALKMSGSAAATGEVSGGVADSYRRSILECRVSSY